MARHGKTRSKSSGRPLHLRLLWITLLAVAGVSAWLAHRDMRPESMQAFHAAALAVPRTMQAKVAARPTSGRVFYPYSVVPGGVASVAELKAAVANDPVVAAHYARFDMSRARVTQSDRERMVYVSYRRGYQLYWTKGKLKLPRGEKLITDGVITARARCGNQVSDTPSAQTSPDEPSAHTLDTPQPPATSSISAYDPDTFDPADWGSDLTMIWQPPSGGASPLGTGPTPLPLYLPPGSGRSAFDTPPVVPPVVPVPEPSPLALLLTAFPAIWAFRKRQNKLR